MSTPNTPQCLSRLPSLSSFGYQLVLIWFGAVFLLSMVRLCVDYFHWQLSLELFDIALWGLFALLSVGLLGTLVPLLAFRFSPFLMSIDVTRTIPHNLSVYEPTPVKLTLTSELSAPNWLTLQLTDYTAQGMTMSDMPFLLDKQALKNLGGNDDWQGRLDFEYALTVFERGAYEFGRTDWRAFSPFGIWYDRYVLRESQPITVKVFASFREIGTHQLNAIASKNTINGLIRERLRGQGQDFHQIRAYNEGDSLRQVDWRATARQHRLMSKEYQNEKEQAILFLVDSSQNMRHKRLVGDELSGFFVSHLDTVLNAMLRLSSLATAQNDAVGFASFSGKHDVIAPPKKGGSAMNYLLNQSFVVDTSLKMPDYISIAKTALSVLKKRSLIVLMTSTRTENTEELLTAIKLLHGKHLVVVANLYEQDLAQFLTSAPTQPTTAQTWQVVRDFLNTQKRLMSQLHGIANVHTIHCTPDKLAGRLTQSYVQLKQKQAW